MGNDVASRGRLIRFGTFELDVPSGELRKGGTRLNLQEQPLQFLLALLDRPGEVVTREELVQRLWRSDTFVDFEHGLNAAVKRMRDTLGDSAETPRFIETVPRRGYRFIAPVEIVDPEGALRLSRSSYPTRIIVASAAAVVVLALIALWWSRLPRSNRGGTLPLHVVTLTTMNGFEAGQVAPDGQHVVFEWDGERTDNRDIYVKLVGASETQRLTTDPAPDFAPTWSHDGRQIAYVRSLVPRSRTRTVVTEWEVDLGLACESCRLWVAVIASSETSRSRYPHAGLRTIAISSRVTWPAAAMPTPATASTSFRYRAVSRGR